MQIALCDDKALVHDGLGDLLAIPQIHDCVHRGDAFKRQILNAVGIQIAIDVASPFRTTYVAGNPPFKIPSFLLKYFGKQFVWAMNHIMTIKTTPGRKAADAIKNKHVAAPLINTSIKDAKLSGVTHVAKIKDIVDGHAVLEDGTVLKVGAVIWCTGYQADFSWIKMDGVTDESGNPATYRGVFPAQQNTEHQGQ